MLRARAICRTHFMAGVGGAVVLLTTPALAQAQTAADIQRANAALQMCMSPAGAAIPQCAQVKQQIGQQLGGGANNEAAASAAAALFNSVAGNKNGAAGLAGLIGSLSSQAKASTPAPGSADYYNKATGATYNAAAAYQACVAANPNNWQSCVAQMNGGAGAGAPMAAINLTGAALAGYQRCLQNNAAEKCAQAYGASAAPAPAPAAAGATVGNAVAAAQAAKQLAPTLKALGSLLGSR